MNLTKENLLADKQELTLQARSLQAQIQYIDGLIAFMDRSEAAPVVDEQPCGSLVDVAEEADA